MQQIHAKFLQNGSIMSIKALQQLHWECIWFNLTCGFNELDFNCKMFNLNGMLRVEFKNFKLPENWNLMGFGGKSSGKSIQQGNEAWKFNENWINNFEVS